MKLKQQNKNEQTFCLWVCAASSLDHSWERNCYLSWDLHVQYKIVTWVTWLLRFVHTWPKVFLKITIYHEAIIDFLYVYKILSVYCQDIFANECGYKSLLW